MRPSPPAIRWTPTRALGRAILLCAALTISGAVTGRIDVIVLAAPFAIGTAWALRARPTQPPAVAFEVAQEEVDEGGAADIALEMSNVDNVRLDLVVGRLTTSGWLIQHPRGSTGRTAAGRGRPYAGSLAPGQTSRVELAATALHWGHHDVGPAMAYGVACDALLVSSIVAAPALRLRVHPTVPPFRAEATMPRTSALVGVHRSRRPGEGGELAGIRQHGPGDRLRRINWRVTLRTGEVHVAHTLSDREAEVVILLDVLHEAGTSGGIHGAASVVDTAVRAAAAIAEHYLRQGDRVGLVEFSGRPRYLRVAAGRRQLRAAQDWLLQARAISGSGNEPVFGIDQALIPANALVVVLTPLLGSSSAQMLATLARAGRSVVAVDTLGDLANRQVPGSEWIDVAQRLWRLDRENLIGLLREAGVPVTAWAGAGSLDQVLLDTSRMAQAPRLGAR